MTDTTAKKLRKPYISASVIRGLASMSDRLATVDSNELAAKSWIARMVDYRDRVACALLSAQDARVCLPSAPEPDSSSGSGEEAIDYA